MNTVNPPAGPDAGQATAHWYEIDTSILSALALTQQGDVGGEDIAPGTHTFFPSISVDAGGNLSATGTGVAGSATWSGKFKSSNGALSSGSGKWKAPSEGSSGTWSGP